ncbi:FxsB family cyclophane-forming radical SAM/SPASM peptide maturase [Actinoplanes derwentensis]|uniref:Radical SAM core domain-containing protein n=1 Tax=Actinoplanes derwentensis TaxID=113562 RepID=A0A1H1WYF7_9ACTN|nr:FxsB family cyclophane-forming radical SAM/SPASM peptide maturase [Actinoplanes derwentensis]GID85778.1 hypothetical protein Ade03nite_47020 [Actinoplanes derwentensis]SDT02208.1 uncharacterized protein SAMN04489716_2279 [Actinoplanes derwentensis]
MHERAAPWPYQQLDVGALRAAGRQPVPVRELVLKVHQRCNLACDYCYVYEMADQSWRDRPRTMPDEIRDAALSRFAEHARRHALTDVRIVLHGGEPLLYGAGRLGELVGVARRAFAPDVRVTFGMQTNGVLLTEAVVATLVEHGIAAGVSVDGTAADHDRHRKTPSGRGSFAAVARGLALLRRPENRVAYAGLLCTVDPATDPIGCYEQLMSFAPPAIDLLLPHANWANPPMRPAGSPTPYADWLIVIFDRWYGDQAPARIRLFDDTISLVLGGASRSEQIGLSPAGMLVIESDGAIEQVDALKSAYPGACATGLHVLRDGFDAALEHPGVVARQIGRDALAGECLACPAVAFCGGGHYAHRYRPGTGFRAPSVHCPDLLKFIRHVYDRVAAELRAPAGSRP